MASSGSFLSSGWYSSSKGDYVYLEFAWAVSATSIENNYKTIYWELRGKRAASGFVNAGGFNVVIDGETVYSKSTDYRIELRNGTVVASGTKTISHNADGTRSFSVSIQGAIYTFAVNSTGAATFTLDTIPRASSISCTTANIESKPTISISRASPNFTHTITYQFGSLTGTIATKTSATSITGWTIPSSFYGQIPDNKEGYGTLTCATYSGNTPVGTSTCPFTATTSEEKCKPTVTGTVVDTNPATVALTGNKDVLVRYCSTALCTLTATLNKSAGRITTRTINNNAITGSTLSIPKVETNVFDFYAKDSREYFDQDKVTKPAEKFIAYIPLTNDAAISRDDPTSNNATLKIDGNYFSGSFGKESNTITVEYKKPSGEVVSVEPNISGNEYSATINLEGYEYNQTFNFEVTVKDKVNTITKTLVLQKGVPVFDWGENDFNFNVPVSIMGNTFLNTFASVSDVDSFVFGDGKFHMGYGIVNDGSSNVGYISFNIGWIALQFKVAPGNVVYKRAKYGNNAWSGWTQM